MKQPLDHGEQCINAVFVDLVAGVDFAPGIKELIVGKKRPGFGIDAIADNAEGVVCEQFRDVAPVAHRQLGVGVVNGGVLADGALKFKHHQRQAVDVQNGIGNARFRADDLQLRHQFDNIAARRIVSRLFRHNLRELSLSKLPKRHQNRIFEQLHIEVFLVAVFALEQEAIGHKLHNRLVAFVEVGRGISVQLTNHRLDLGGRDAVRRILPGQKCPQIGFDEYLLRLALDGCARHMGIAFGVEQFDDGRLPVGLR